MPMAAAPLPFDVKEYISYIDGFRERHGGTAFEVVNDLVKSPHPWAKVEGYAVFLLSNLFTTDEIRTEAKMKGLT